ncbi:hypothetical protein A3K62_02890 [Candidatus Pacearchaeota archaeon RBG_16_35_8]|nr:MAG: hypothetical protein A3K62_02890 [Candidatus Pacearchaeota archaeon RBG_16_35_8]
MKIKVIDTLILIFLFLAIISLNYSPVDKYLEQTFSVRTSVFIERIIDGDTIESDIGNIRLLGINTPERGEKYYNEARDFLKKKIENKTVELEFTGETHDKYRRVLAYVFLENKNINIELVENGFANYYFYGGKDRYSNLLEEAWNKCINNKINLCEPSINQCSNCIFLENIDVLKNECDFDCNITGWKIKGEGRNNTIFSETLNNREKTNFDIELMDSEDTIFLWDDEGKLVFWHQIRNP